MQHINVGATRLRWCMPSGLPMKCRRAMFPVRETSVESTASRCLRPSPSLWSAVSPSRFQSSKYITCSAKPGSRGFSHASILLYVLNGNAMRIASRYQQRYQSQTVGMAKCARPSLLSSRCTKVDVESNLFNAGESLTSRTKYESVENNVAQKVKEKARRQRRPAASPPIGFAFIVTLPGSSL